MSWFSRGLDCIHCKETKTKREFEGQPACPVCRMNILCNREPRRNCPVDGTLLVKAYNNDEIIIDRCPECNGIWLDVDELEAISTVKGGSGLLPGIVMSHML